MLKADKAIGDKWLVTDGLKAGDRVIVSGLMKVRRPGAQVKVQEKKLTPSHNLKHRSHKKRSNTWPSSL